MAKTAELKTNFVIPGKVLVPAVPTVFKAVVATGIVITAFDHSKKIGGICYYTHPRRENGLNTTRFAAPSILLLVKKLERIGCKISDLEFNIYGGATNKKAIRYRSGWSEDNIKVAKEILAKKKCIIIANDCGGVMARKVLFNTSNGELVIARVASVREKDWYPTLNYNGIER